MPEAIVEEYRGALTDGSPIQTALACRPDTMLTAVCEIYYCDDPAFSLHAYFVGCYLGLPFQVN